MFKKSIFVLMCLLLSSWNNKPVSIFLIGDSISINYYPYLKQNVAQFAILSRKLDDGKSLQNLDVPMGANGGDSKMVLKYLKSRLDESDFNPDYVLLNCGLHDMKRNPQTNEIQVSELDYRSNLTEIFRALKKKGIKPIWITTTAVVDSIHNARSGSFKRYNADVIKYNEIAKQICTSKKIPIIDLYTFTKQFGVDQYIDHVHYKAETQKLQAKYIAEMLEKITK